MFEKQKKYIPLQPQNVQNSWIMWGQKVPIFYIIMIEEKYIINLINDHYQNTDKFLISLKITTSNKIEIYIDSDSTVTIDDCAELNQYLEERLDGEIDDYDMMVSSAGITNPILLTRQFKKYIGQKFTVIDNEGKKTIGILKEANNEGITITERALSKVKKGMKPKVKEEEDVFFPKDEYASAKLFLDF